MKFQVHAPGRVNLIGDHTDYNDGFVLPMTINHELLVDCQPRKDDIANIYTKNYDEKKSFSLNNIKKQPDDKWLAYVKGVAYYLQQKFGELVGFDATIQSSIPQGAGLSSSAALELAIARTFAQTSNLPWQPTEMALLAQTAENKWVGMNCGIMDQLVIAHGKRDHALLIDCQNLNIQLIPIPKNLAVVIMDTMTRHTHVDSDYNKRRQYCEQAVQLLNLASLRDITFENWQQISKKLPAKYIPKIRHVVHENHRVLQAATAMQQNDAIQLGKLMNESHLSLKNDFEVSNQQLDIMVKFAQNFLGCYGARMTGGGFGGCAVAIVEIEKAEEFKQQITAQYHQATNLKPQLYICHATEGVNLTT
ncbi:MAG: galactokinase [Gammaproteobacteria bacterium]|jgi:galactokinase